MMADVGCIMNVHIAALVTFVERSVANVDAIKIHGW